MNEPDDILTQLEKLANDRARFAPVDLEEDDYMPVDLQLAGLEADSDKPSSREMLRIVSLPSNNYPKLGEQRAERFCYDRIEAKHYERGFRLFDPQLAGWLAYLETGGVFGAIGVGWGKTLLCAAIANSAYVERGKKKILLCIPSNVFDQLTQVDLAWIRARINLSVPFHILGQKSAQRRKATFLSGYKGCYIATYSLLSTTDANDMLRAIQPDLVILDEAHNLKNREAARTKRLFSYLEDHEDVELCAFSGTITSKGVEDYHHIIRRALGDNCPLPQSVRLAGEWGMILNSGAVPSEAQAAELVPLIEWARAAVPEEKFPANVSGFRKAYKERFRTAPGVVTTHDSEIGCSLVISNVPVQDYENCEGWEELSIIMRRIETMWVTPTDDEIEHAIHAYKWLYEMSAGFYNELYWPTARELARSKQISEAEADDLLSGAMDHHLAHQEYARGLRNWLGAHQRAGIDTPMLVGLDMAKNGSRNVGRDLYELWCAMKNLEFADMPERWSRAIRVCPFKVNAAVEWAKGLPAGKGGIVWVHHQEMGLWAWEAMIEAGIDALHCPAGKQANQQIIDPAHAHRIVVASLDAHGEGKNLQHFEHMFYLQWPRRAVRAEQSLGRFHRNGQLADEVEARCCRTIDFDDLVFAACLQDGLYIHQTTGVRQKVIYATHAPMPRIYSPEFLRERGMENEQLNQDMRRAIQERFGDFRE